MRTFANLPIACCAVLLLTWAGCSLEPVPLPPGESGGGLDAGTSPTTAADAAAGGSDGSGIVIGPSDAAMNGDGSTSPVPPAADAGALPVDGAEDGGGAGGLDAATDGAEGDAAPLDGGAAPDGASDAGSDAPVLDGGGASADSGPSADASSDSASTG